MSKVEQLLPESEEKFKCIYHQSPIAIEIFDAEGVLVDANPQCLEIFSINDLSEVKGFKLFDDPNLPQVAKENFLQVVSVSYAHEFDSLILNGNSNISRKPSKSTAGTVQRSLHRHSGFFGKESGCFVVVCPADGRP